MSRSEADQVVARMAVLEEKFDSLAKGDERMRAHVTRLYAKLDRLTYLLIATLTAAVIQLGAQLLK